MSPAVVRFGVRKFSLFFSIRRCYFQVSFDIHACMKNAGDCYAVQLLAVKHNMVTCLETSEAFVNFFPRSANLWRVSKLLKIGGEFNQILFGLLIPPVHHGVELHFSQVVLRLIREPIFRHQPNS